VLNKVTSANTLTSSLGASLPSGYIPAKSKATAHSLATADRVVLSAQTTAKGQQPGVFRPALQPNGVPYLPAYTYTSGNKVNIFYDSAEIEPQMEKLIGEARESIKIDYFIFSGQEAMRLAEMIVAKAKAGVKVEIMFDPRVGSLPALMPGEKKVLDYLKQNGIQVVLANYDALPPRIDQRESTTARLIDHNKILVVDDRAAMIGGWNLADSFEHFHDAMVRIDGPAVGDLVQQMSLDRYFAQHPDQAKAEAATPAVVRPDRTQTQAGLSTVRVNSTGINRQNNQWAILESISKAQKSVYVTQLELNDDSIIDALIVAKDRGVDVRVLLDPSDFADVVPLLKTGPKEWVDAEAVKRLLDAGVPVHYFKTTPQQDVVHAKMAVYDGNEVMLGSADWQTLELRNTSDTSVEVHGGPAPQRAQQVFLDDWQQKSTPAAIPAFYKRILSRLYFAFS